jgi:hypothetical protein
LAGTDTLPAEHNQNGDLPWCWKFFYCLYSRWAHRHSLSTSVGDGNLVPLLGVPKLRNTVNLPVFASFRSSDLFTAPLLEDVPLSYSLTRFNGSLLKENIYRRPASPEVDAAWASLGTNFRALIVPEPLAKMSSLAPDQVKVNQKYGGGYPANVEGLHHLHCLNLLRQGLWYNFDYYREAGQGAFKNEDYIVKFHVSHCLDILRQQLMCTVDVGVLGQVWLHPEAPEAYVDFNTEHKCRNFEAIKGWAEVRQMPEKVPEDWLEPPKLGDRIYEEIP